MDQTKRLRHEFPPLPMEEENVKHFLPHQSKNYQLTIPDIKKDLVVITFTNKQANPMEHGIFVH